MAGTPGLGFGRDGESAHEQGDGLKQGWGGVAHGWVN
jgi:hypothetical protein